MKKISKKIIPIKAIDLFWEKPLVNFSLQVSNTLNFNFENINIIKYKKGLYCYFLPGKFKLSLKKYFPLHTYINLDMLGADNLCGNTMIVLFTFKNNIFLNNLEILRYNDKIYNYEIIKNISKCKNLLFYCLLFYMD